MCRVSDVSRVTLRAAMLISLAALVGCVTSPTLMYEHNNEVWKMHDDGTGKTKLVSNGNFPKWIPKLKDKIAYVRNKSGKTALFTADDEGKNETQLTAYNVGEDFSWSPDRNWIAFQTDRDGNWEIYKVNVNTKQEVRLTTDKADDLRPQWSPSGSKIAFESNRRNQDWDIWVMDASGKNLQNLTDSGVGDGADRNAVWSPDGTRIAHICNHIGWGGPKICVAYSAMPGTTGPVSQYGSDGVTAPLWSTSGDYIFYVDMVFGKSTLYTQEGIAGKKSQVLSTWSGFTTSRYMDESAGRLFFTKGADLYRIHWPGGKEQKLGSGSNPDVW
jgi:Tol biopolymer transport system component